MYLAFPSSATGEKYFFRQRRLNDILFRKKDALLFSRGAKSRADFALPASHYLGNQNWSIYWMIVPHCHSTHLRKENSFAIKGGAILGCIFLKTVLWGCLKTRCDIWIFPVGIFSWRSKAVTSHLRWGQEDRLWTKYILTRVISRNIGLLAAGNKDIRHIEWVLYPACDSKTRFRIHSDTILENFLLFCPKCKHETWITVWQRNLSIIQEPDAKTQSR